MCFKTYGNMLKCNIAAHSAGAVPGLTIFNVDNFDIIWSDKNIMALKTNNVANNTCQIVSLLKNHLTRTYICIYMVVFPEELQAQPSISTRLNPYAYKHSLYRRPKTNMKFIYHS